MTYKFPIAYSFETGDGQTILICNHLNGVPLNSWWIFEVQTEDIEGTLTDPLQNGMSGPFITPEAAFKALGLPPDKNVNLVDNLSMQL